MGSKKSKIYRKYIDVQRIFFIFDARIGKEEV